MFYKVVAKCGHVGKRKYIEVSFAVKSENKKDAAQFILSHSKVKKQLKNAISFVEEISFDEYNHILNKNSDDDYFKAHYSGEYDILNYNIKEYSEKQIYKSDREFANREEKIKYLFKKRRINERTV